MRMIINCVRSLIFLYFICTVSCLFYWFGFVIWN